MTQILFPSWEFHALHHFVRQPEYGTTNKYDDDELTMPASVCAVPCVCVCGRSPATPRTICDAKRENRVHFIIYAAHKFYDKIFGREKPQ